MLQRRVIEAQLLIRRRLEDGSIALHVTLGDGQAAGRVTIHHPPHQLFEGRIEKTEFDRYAERSCGFALLIALRASPKTPFEHNRGSQHEEPLCQFPEGGFEPGLEALVERINAQGQLPLIRVEPHRTICVGKLACELRLPRSREAAQQHQPRLHLRSCGHLDDDNSSRMREISDTTRSASP